jgi:acetylornithine deacetylase/succinyl-diaminopimelate desuccinylase-like protein
MTPALENIRLATQERQAAIIDFTKHLVRIPSLPGREQEIVPVITHEMNELGYDEVWTDQAGNIIGKINGGPGPVVLLNGHMDHVDPGPDEGGTLPGPGCGLRHQAGQTSRPCMFRAKLPAAGL